jgi:hypothetical protein
MKSNIWFFGDSYLEHDANWVRFVADRCNAKIQELGVGGSSIPYLLKKLHQCGPSIKKDDYVVVSFTCAFRHYFAGLHLLQQMIRKPVDEDHHHQALNPYGFIEWEFRRQGVSRKDVTTVEWQKKILNVLNSYNGFLEHLYDEPTQKLESFSIVSNIINNILPTLPTKKVIYFYSIDREDYEESLYFQKGTQPTVDSFYHQQLDFFAQNQNYDLDKDGIMAELKNKNHWIENPEMQKRFWTINNPILKLIGADNPDLII